MTNIWKDENVEKQQKMLEHHFPKAKKLIDKIVDVAGQASNTRYEAESTSEDREHQMLERAFSRELAFSLLLGRDTKEGQSPHARRN